MCNNTFIVFTTNVEEQNSSPFRLNIFTRMVDKPAFSRWLRRTALPKRTIITKVPANIFPEFFKSSRERANTLWLLNKMGNSSVRRRKPFQVSPFSRQLVSVAWKETYSQQFAFYGAILRPHQNLKISIKEIAFIQVNLVCKHVGRPRKKNPVAR